MIDINLLPEHLRPIKRSPLPHIISIALLVGVLVVLASDYLNSMREIAASEDELATLQTELDTLMVYVEEAEQLAEQKGLLADKIEAIDDIVSDRIIWSRQLWNLSRLAPPNFWYSGIRVVDRQFRERRTDWDRDREEYVTQDTTVRRPVLEVSGYVAPERGGADVSPLMQAAEQDPEFSAMFQLEPPTFRDTEFEGYAVRSFTLEFIIEPGASHD